MKTSLADRTLWFDGVSEVTPDKLPDLLLKGIPVDKLAVTEVTLEVKSFNRVADKPVTVKQELSLPDILAWSLPDRYKYLDLEEYLLNLPVAQDELHEARLVRLAEEIDLFLSLGLSDLLRCLLYVVDELTKQRIVWGVGRGSSCSSYLLYLIGLHEVDPVKYGIPITDFLRID